MSNPSAVLEQMPEAAPNPAGILGGLHEPQRRQLPAWFQRSAARGLGAIPEPADAGAERSGLAFFECRCARSFALHYGATACPRPTRREILERSTGLDEICRPAGFRRRSIPASAIVLSEKLRKAGVIFQPLERAMIEHEDLFRRHFMSQPATLGSAKFAALHEAFVRSGTFLYVPRGVEIELPLETFHWLHAENAAIFPHTLVVADELSKVTVVEHFRSTDRQRAGFACGVNDLIVGRRREGDLHLRARLERQSAEHPNQRHHRRPRCVGAESSPRISAAIIRASKV